MTDQQPGDGWGAVPSVDSISGTREPAAEPAPTPVRRRRRRGRVAALVSGGVAVVLLLVAGVVGYSVGTSTHAPDRPVRAFLDDLEAGRVEAALRTAGITTEDADVLLTDDAYAKASGRVTGYRIAAVESDGDAATVRAYLRQGGNDVSAVFSLERTGTEWGVFPVWDLQAPTLGSVDVSLRAPSGTKVSVAGRSVSTSDGGTATLRALPGTYAVTVEGGKWFTAEGADATVSGFSTSPSSQVSLAAELTDAGQQAAKAAVDAWVDGCIASTEAAPSGCSFYAYGEDPAYTYTNQKWTLGTRPVVEIGAWASSGWQVTTTTSGRATFTADISGPGGVGTASAGPMNVNASGSITGIDDEGARFVSAIGNGSSDAGT